MKRGNAIMSLFEKHDAKVKKNASSSSPTMRPTPMVEGLTEGQDVAGEGLTAGSGAGGSASNQDSVQPPMEPEVNVVVLAAADVNPTPSSLKLQSLNSSNPMPRSTSNKSVYNPH